MTEKEGKNPCGMSHMIFRQKIDLFRPTFLACYFTFFKVDIEHGFEKGKQPSVQHAKQSKQAIRVLNLTYFRHRDRVGNHLPTRR